jgi:hypothetical protein
VKMFDGAEELQVLCNLQSISGPFEVSTHAERVVAEHLPCQRSRDMLAASGAGEDV